MKKRKEGIECANSRKYWERKVKCITWNEGLRMEELKVDTAVVFHAQGSPAEVCCMGDVLYDNTYQLRTALNVGAERVGQLGLTILVI
jgi:hypothetical protein